MTLKPEGETMDYQELVVQGRRTIKARSEEATALGLSTDFMEGFAEGIAEMIVRLSFVSDCDISLACADVLEDLDFWRDGTAKFPTGLTSAESVV